MKVSLTATGIVLAAAVAGTAPLRGQAPATPPVGSRPAAASTIPSVAEFYILSPGDGTAPRVQFLQSADVLTATWMTAQGDTYGQGTYRWDADSGSFKGTSSTSSFCLADDMTMKLVPYVAVREELSVVTDRELRDRWTKPLKVDCLIGLMEVFKWQDLTWIAADKDWKPLATAAAPDRR